MPIVLQRPNSRSTGPAPGGNHRGTALARVRDCPTRRLTTDRPPAL